MIADEIDDGNFEMLFNKKEMQRDKDSEGSFFSDENDSRAISGDLKKNSF